jgi:hypothetical protein
MYRYVGNTSGLSLSPKSQNIKSLLDNAKKGPPRVLCEGIAKSVSGRAMIRFLE